MSLDDTLAAWAESVRVPDATATDIYRQIVTAGARVEPIATGLDAKWWRTFSAEFSASMITSTRATAWAA